MKDLPKQDFRVFFDHPEGADHGSMVVKDVAGHVAAAVRAGEILRGTAMARLGEGWRVTKVRPLKQMTPAQSVAEAAVV